MRLQLSRATDLALRALVALPDGDERVKGASLAAAIGTTPALLPQVLQPLVAAGWVASARGPTGGYRLATTLDALSVRAVVEAVEGPTADGRCALASGSTCPGEDPCPLHAAWTHARDVLLEELDGLPVGTLALSGDGIAAPEEEPR